MQPVWNQNLIPGKTFQNLFMLLIQYCIKNGNHFFNFLFNHDIHSVKIQKSLLQIRVLIIDIVNKLTKTGTVLTWIRALIVLNFSLSLKNDLLAHS